MTSAPISPESLASAIDASIAPDLAARMIEIPSPTGEEAEFARFLAETLGEFGVPARLQTIYEDRLNVVGELGDGGGVRVLWSGHMDTSVRGDEPWLQGIGWENRATIRDGVVWGNGIRNMKGAFVAYLVALDAMRRLGVELPGRLVVAATSGEIELAGVGEFGGRDYDSVGMGLRHLLTHGTAVDYHLLGEPTGLVPFLGNPGALWAQLTVRGSFSHTAFSDRGVHAIEEAWRLWRGLDPWIAEYRARYETEGSILPVNRASIRGGLPWRAARTPAECSMTIDIRIPPDAYPADIQREFEAAVADIAERELSGPVAVEWFLSRPGTMLPAEHPIVNALRDSTREVLGTAPEPVPYIGVCSDAMDANRLGVDTVQFGIGRPPGESSRSTSGVDLRAAQGEFARIDDLLALAQVYVLATDALMRDGLGNVTRRRPPGPGVAVR